MTSNMALRPGRPADAPLAAVTFRLSMGGLAEQLFGQDGRAVEMALIRLFSRNAGRFGYEQSTVVEWNNKAFGMLVAFPGADLNRLSWSVARHLPMAFGMRVFGFVARSLRLASIREAEADEYYVSNLAVLPAVQGQGLGSVLLEHADQQARTRGLTKCSLLVSPDNANAVGLYKRHGYKIVQTQHDKNPFASYHRMVKKL